MFGESLIFLVEKCPVIFDSHGSLTLLIHKSDFCLQWKTIWGWFSKNIQIVWHLYYQDCMDSQIHWGMNNSNDKISHAVFDRKILLGKVLINFLVVLFSLFIEIHFCFSGLSHVFFFSKSVLSLLSRLAPKCQFSLSFTPTCILSAASSC